MTGSEDPERGLVLAYAPSVAAARALAALLALDDRLAETVRTTSEPMLGQIRLKWWQEAIAGLDSAASPAEPVLQTLQRDVIAFGVSGADVARIAEAWGEVLGEELDDAAIARFAMRGRALFEAAGRVAGAGQGEAVGLAGEGWALADLAQGLSDAAEIARVRDAASAALVTALAGRWHRNERALGAMAHLARLDLAGVPRGSPRRVGRALWHRMTGR